MFLGCELHGVVGLAFSEIPRDGHAIVVSRFGPPPAMVRLRANRAIGVLDGQIFT